MARLLLEGSLLLLAIVVYSTRASTDVENQSAGDAKALESFVEGHKKLNLIKRETGDNFNGGQKKRNRIKKKSENKKKKRGGSRKGGKRKQNGKTKKSSKKRKATKKTGPSRRQNKGKKNRKNKKKRNNRIKKAKKKKKAENQKRRGSKKGATAKSVRQCTAQDTCVTDMANFLKLYGIQIRTLDRQISRVKNSDKLVTSKQGKMDDFSTNRDTVLNALGGNSTKPKCGGDNANDTDAENLSTLVNCNVSVKANCEPLLNSTNQALLDSCTTILNTARDEMAKVIGAADPTTICSVVSSVPTSMQKDVTDCIKSIGDLDSALLVVKKSCISAFGACRVAERSSLSTISQCKTGPGGVANAADAKKQLDVLNKVNSVLGETEAKVDSAMEEAGVKDGPGSDGTLPTSRMQRSFREIRQDSTEDPRCTAVLDGWKAFNTSASEAVKDSDSPVDSEAADKTTAALTSITNRPDLAGDLKSCQKETSRQFKIIVIIRIRFYIFWSRFWRIRVIQIKITIIIIQYPNISTTTTSNPTTTTATTTPTTTSTTVTTTKTVTTTGVRRRENIYMLL